MSDLPSILFVFSDQQRWDTMGCYGQRLPVTPNLDALAADGVRFANAFTCQPVCGPARAALQTGKYKRSCHDSCLRIPLLVRGPGFRGGRVVPELVSLLDLPPTLLAAGGVTPPVSMVGQALQPLAAGTATAWRDHVYAEISEDHIGRTIRTARWKYAVRAPGEGRWSGCASPGSDVYREECLYDLEADPHERRNLVGEPALAGRRADLRQRLVACMTAAGERAPEILPAAGGSAKRHMNDA